MSEEITGHYLFQIADALNYTHEKGITHRDVKPGNVLVMFDEKTVKLTDFGSASLQRKDPMHTKIGTMEFCAPEINLSQQYDHSVDVWSTGCMLYHLLTGVIPFANEYNGNMYRDIKNGKYKSPKNVSLGAKSLISRMIRVKAEERISCMEIMFDDWTQNQREKMAASEKRREFLTINGSE